MNESPQQPDSELARLRAEVAELRAEVARLDGDLDESRRLNLRAAELLDIVYETLGKPQGLSD
jgi:cell division protein FtsB